MTIETCPKCGVRLQFRQPFTAGQNARCARCKNVWTPIPAPPAAAPTPPAAPNCVFEKVWFERSMSSSYGLLIHADIVIHGMQGEETSLTAYCNFANGAPLKPRKKRVDQDGTARVWTVLEPESPAARFRDVQLFLEFHELCLLPGHQHALRFWLSLSSASATIASSIAYNFIVDTDEPLGYIRDVRAEGWYDPNAGQGILIHADLGISYAAGRQAQVIAFFSNENGQPLRDTNGSYRTQDGQVSVGDQVSVTSNEIEAPDFRLFIPVTELHLAPGSHHKCQFVVAAFISGSLGLWTPLAHFPPFDFSVDTPAAPPPATTPMRAAGSSVQKSSVSKPGLFKWLTGKTCPNCGKRGYQEFVGRTLRDRYVTSREQHVTDIHMSAYGASPEIGRSQRTAYKTVTVEVYDENYICKNCGGTFYFTKEHDL